MVTNLRSGRAITNDVLKFRKVIDLFSGFSFTTIHRTAGVGGGHSFNSSLPLPSASQTLRHQPCDCYRELTPAHRQQSDSNRELLDSWRKSLTTQLHALKRTKIRAQILKFTCLNLLLSYTYLIINEKNHLSVEKLLKI